VLGNGDILLGNGDSTFTYKATAAGTGQVVVADFNNDGKDDLAFSGTGIQILLGNGDGTFQTGALYAKLYGALHSFATDIDGDGNVDLVIGDGSNGVYKADEDADGTMLVLVGNGDGTFVGARQVSSATSTVANGTFATGDFNGDGNVDVLGASLDKNGNTVGMVTYLGDGKGGLSGLAANTTVVPYQLFAADMNSDKKLDAVALALNTTTSAVSISVLNGNGDGTFAAPATYPVANYTTTFPAVDVAIGDLRGIGKPDVLVSIDGLLYLLKNNGDGTLAAAALISNQSANSLAIQRILLADLNGDGKPDLVADVSTTTAGTASSAQTLVFLNNGNGTFSAPASYSPGGYSAVGDMNHDGKVDLVVAANVTTSGSNTRTYFQAAETARSVLHTTLP
jgi:FG-GAP-like repeat